MKKIIFLFSVLILSPFLTQAGDLGALIEKLPADQKVKLEGCYRSDLNKAVYNSIVFDQMFEFDLRRADAIKEVGPVNSLKLVSIEKFYMQDDQQDVFRINATLNAKPVKGYMEYNDRCISMF